MSSELNKIFGRDFVTGFFLPALLFLLANVFLLKFLGVRGTLLNINWQKPLEDTGLLIIMAGILAIFLQAFNREVFRAAEGYWPKWLSQPLTAFHRRRFRKLTDKVNVLYNSPGEIDEREFNALSYRAAMEYPSTEAQVLPTSFGNAVRAYEDYPRVIYGFESIKGWTRLQALMSPEFCAGLAQTRAPINLWLNLCLLTVVFAVEVAGLAYDFNRFGIMWLILPLLILAWFTYARARSSAQQYGEHVKAAFDIYLPALANKLGYALSSDVGKNMEFWTAFSEIMIYRDARALTDVVGAGLHTTAVPRESDEKQLNTESDKN